MGCVWAIVSLLGGDFRRGANPLSMIHSSCPPPCRGGAGGGWRPRRRPGELSHRPVDKRKGRASSPAFSNPPLTPPLQGGEFEWDDIQITFPRRTLSIPLPGGEGDRRRRRWWRGNAAGDIARGKPPPPPSAVPLPLRGRIDGNQKLYLAIISKRSRTPWAPETSSRRPWRNSTPRSTGLIGE